MGGRGVIRISRSRAMVYIHEMVLDGLEREKAMKKVFIVTYGWPVAGL